MSVQVQHGWSGEIGGRWAKFRVTLDEDDLRRLIAGAGFTDPDTVRRGLSTGVAFQLLELEAEKLILVKLILRYGYDSTNGRHQINQLDTKKANLLAALPGAR